LPLLNPLKDFYRPKEIYIDLQYLAVIIASFWGPTSSREPNTDSNT